MHQQCLARYDTERHVSGLPLVESFLQWDDPLGRNSFIDKALPIDSLAPWIAAAIPPVNTPISMKAVSLHVTWTKTTLTSPSIYPHDCLARKTGSVRRLQYPGDLGGQLKSHTWGHFKTAHYPVGTSKPHT